MSSPRSSGLCPDLATCEACWPPARLPLGFRGLRAAHIPTTRWKYCVNPGPSPAGAGASSQSLGVPEVPSVHPPPPHKCSLSQEPRSQEQAWVTWPVCLYAPGQLSAALRKSLLCTRLQGWGWGDP